MLANKVGVALNIIRSSIKQAFEQAGIEFFDDDGALTVDGARICFFHRLICYEPDSHGI
jgi:hypothetical protein